MIIYDAEGKVMGRMCSVIAKQLLRGEDVTVVNVEKAVISGNPKTTVEHYHKRVKRGDPIKGPFFPRTPDGIFRRSVRGMLPMKKSVGKAAYKRLRVSVGVPDRLKSRSAQFKKIKAADAGKLRTRSVTLSELSAALGAKKRW